MIIKCACKEYETKLPYIEMVEDWTDGVLYKYIHDKEKCLFINQKSFIARTVQNGCTTQSINPVKKYMENVNEV